MALCKQSSDTNECTLVFRADIEDNEEWNIIIIHELLHVKHARIDHYLERVVFPETGAYTHDSIIKGYRTYYESFIHSLAAALYEDYLDTQDKVNDKQV